MCCGKKTHNLKDVYYKAYEERYAQVYEKNMLWSTTRYTPDVINFLNNYNATLDNKILDLGCGEGRDAIHLLEKGYDVLAVDYSQTVINMCNELTSNKYQENFKQLDLIKDEMSGQFDFIYSVAVLHMFVLEEHRNKFWEFIKKHLNENGRCLICVLGNGEDEKVSDISKAFEKTERIVMSNNKKLMSQLLLVGL